MRIGRYEFWFPLALTGFVLLGILTFAMNAGGGWFAYAPPPAYVNAGVDQFLVAVRGVPFSEYESLEPPPPVAWGELSGVLALFLVTVAWYAWRARRAGTPVRSRRLMLVTGGGVLAVIAGYVVLDGADTLLESGRLARALALPLLLLGVCFGVLAYFSRGRWRRIAAATSGTVLSVTLLIVAVPALPDSPLVPTVVAGLTVLAWLERSVLLAVVTAGFLLAAAAARFEPLTLLLPAAVLLAGAMAALLLRGRPDPAS
ncbi:hypothetical protein [Qaidamihabitans albus]|uniref:hypothetical protein n=1 Tax=Qaidamihabitans albus TaxID=2795733 RepID=UPI0018F17783|nr:hypothetical protein [Qaidamihabitans albus]